MSKLEIRDQRIISPFLLIYLGAAAIAILTILQMPSALINKHIYFINIKLVI